MSMSEYEARFIKLSYHVAFLIPTEAKKVRQFIEGLTYGIKSYGSKVGDWDYFPSCHGDILKD